MTDHAIAAPQIIIENPRAQTRFQFATGIVLTLLIWGGWVYLTWPFVGICLMKLGVPVLPPEEIAYYSRDLLPELADIARWCIAVLAASAVLFPAWIAYHVARFSSQPNARRVIHTAPSAVAEALHVPPGDVTTWQTARRAVIRHEEAGRIPHIQAA